MPELRQLRYFVAVAEELNFSRAARRLRMAQPPLSAAIRRLEAELGTELFRRSSREVTLTDAGRTLLAGARRTLAEAERAVSDAKRAGAGELGRLRIAFSWSERFQTLRSVAQVFRARYPDVDLLTEEMWNSKMIDALRSGAVDVAIALCPEISDGIAYRHVRSERAVAIVAATHPLATESEVDTAALAGDGIVLFPRELAPRLFDRFIAICRDAGFEPVVRPESFHTAWELGTLEDVGVVALAPESVVGGLPSGLTALRLREAPQLETHALSRADDPSQVVRRFLEAAASVFPAERPAPT